MMARQSLDTTRVQILNSVVQWFVVGGCLAASVGRKIK